MDDIVKGAWLVIANKSQQLFNGVSRENDSVSNESAEKNGDDLNRLRQ